MPSPPHNFPGLSFTTVLGADQAGAGWPPDTNGDVGPVYFIQAVNDAWGIFNKATGTLTAGFTENQLWAAAASGTPCDSDNFGDPVAIHDGLADRWVLTNFAFATDGGGNPVAPFYQCIAVSKTSEPVTGGWYLYAVQMDVGTAGAPPAHTFADYPKFGFWTDCLYMGANGFNNDTGHYAGPIFAAFDRTALFAGSPLTSTNSSIGFIDDQSTFGLFPANLLGTRAASLPPAGTAEYFVDESSSAYQFDVRKFHKSPSNTCGSNATLDPAVAVSQASYGYPANTAGTTTNIEPQPSTAQKLDSLGDEIMQRVQYRKIGNAESLWVVHTTCGTGVSSNGTCATNTTPTQPQWAQIDVTGGTVASTPLQQQIYHPSDTLYRWMGSVAVDAQGNMALGFSTSNAVAPNFPSISYAGRLASDSPNQLPQTEFQLAAGLGPQKGINRWGDYSAMVIDPSDDCTFWYTTEYYATVAHSNTTAWDTQIGSFKFPGCASTYTVSANVSGGHGTATPASQSIDPGTPATITVTPDAGYHVVSVVGDTCTLTQQTSTTWQTGNILAACAVTATFAIDTFTVTAVVSGGNGTIAPPSQTVNWESSATLTITPAVGYHVQSVIGDTCTASQGIGTTWTTAAITSNCAITATFAIDTFNVTSSVLGGNGTISPPSQTVNSGATATFTVTPSPGFQTQSVIGDTCTVAQTSGTTWTSSAIGADCAVVAIFAADVLVFTTQPSDLPRGAELGTVVATEKDSLGNTVDDSATVDFTVAACGGSVDLGSVAMVHGVATLASDQAFYTVAAGLQIQATATTASGTSQLFSVLPNTDIRFADGFEGCRL
jgi:hypothetical protein